MSNRNLTNVSASVRAKLLNKARASKRPFSELLQYFAMERFLYRLSISPHSQKFILKGALMFTAWEFTKHRATMDIDMLANTSNNLDNLITIIRDICHFQPDVDDGILFDGGTVEGKVSQTHKEYSGVQLKFDGKLSGARIQMKVDIGFGDIISPSPSQITYPSILPFPSPKLKGYTAETVIAEKFQTIVSRGSDNSRMKDFYDIWTLQRQMEFEGKNLLEAIAKTFINRQTEFTEASINELKLLGESQVKTAQWEQFIRKNQFDLETPSFENIINEIIDFLSPLATEKNTIIPGKWSSLLLAWSPGNPGPHTR